MSASAMSPSFKSGPRERFLAFVHDEESAKAVKAYGESHGWPSSALRDGDIRDAASYLQNHRTPQALLVELPKDGDADMLLGSLADVCEPDVRVFVSGAVNEFSFFRKLKELGVEDYFLQPVMPDHLRKTLEQPVKLTGKEEHEKPSQHVIAVIGTRGGSGATTLTVNLATICAKKFGKECAVLDPDPHFGGVALALDVEPSRGLRDAFEKPERLDALFLDRVTVRHESGVAVLSAEESIGEAVKYQARAVPLLLQELEKKFPLVLIDMPRLSNEFTRSLLQHAERIMLVSELSIAGLRDALRIMDMLRELGLADKVTVVANKVGLAKKGEMPARDFQKNLGHNIDATIPFDAEVYHADDTGKPIALIAPNSRAARVVEKMAQDICGEAPAEEKKKSSLLRFLKP